MGKIYLLMGKSASGKDSLRKEILSALCGLGTYTSYTTRPIRRGETSGDEYYFVGEEELQKYRDTGKLIESRTYETKLGPWSYATIDDGQIDLSEKSYLMEGTLDSFQSLRNYFGRESVVPVYIEVDDEERLSRALLREEAEKTPRYEEVMRRFSADNEDFSEEKLFAAGIGKRYRNDDFAGCAEKIIEDIKKSEGI